MNYFSHRINAMFASLLLALSLLVLPAHAGINDRLERQEERINEGVASGELTKREAARLKYQSDVNAQKERRYRSDGVLTERERLHLHKDLTRTSHSIYHQKHDGQSRH